MLAPEQVEETIGEAEVRQLFRISRLGVIAGCYVTNGTVRRNAQVRVVRDGTVVYDATLASLKRFKDDVREVQEGFECGIQLEGFNDVKEGDVLEFYETREIERTERDLVTPAEAPPTPPGRRRSGPSLSQRARRDRLGNAMGIRVRRHPLGRAPLPREPLAEGEAQGAALGEGAARAPLRRLRCRGRPPRGLAAGPAHAGVRRAGAASCESCSTGPSATSPGRSTSCSRASERW